MSSFGTNGVAVLDLAGGGRAELPHAALTDGNATLVVGQANNGTDDDLVLARVTSSGALDTNFGTGGKLLINRGGSEVGYAIIPDVMGWFVGGNGGSNMLVTRVLPGGTVDATFATNGYFEQTFGSSGLAYGFAYDGQHLFAAGTIRTTGNQDLGVCSIIP